MIEKEKDGDKTRGKLHVMVSFHLVLGFLHRTVERRVSLSATVETQIVVFPVLLLLLRQLASHMALQVGSHRWVD